MGLDRRMADEDRLKHRALKRVREWGRREELSSRDLGRLYSTHGAQCSCYMCGNPRTHFGERSLAERKINQED